MNRKNSLGFAFLFQGITSLVSNAVIVGPVIKKFSEAGSVDILIANSQRISSGLLLDCLTAVGIILLGSLLYLSTKSISKSRSLVALSLYISEATILVISKSILFPVVSLAIKGSSDYALMASLIETADLLYILHLIPFALGALLFYNLLERRGILSKGIALWGVISVAPFIIGAPLQIVGVDVPFLIYLPYVPFEFFVGFYLIFRLKPRKEAT